MVYETPAELRELTIDNEIKILTGEVDPDVIPVRRLYGPSLATRESVRNVVLTAGQEFGSFFGGCEFLMGEERDQTVDYIATIVGSKWQHPECVPSPYTDYI